MPINAQIPLQVQRPKIMSPGDLLSLKDLSTRAQMNEFQLEEAKANAPLQRKLSEIAMMKDQQAHEAELIKRRDEYSKEVNEYVYKKGLQVRATGASQQAIDQAVREAYQEILGEQEKSGKLRMAGIDDTMLAQARTKAPTFRDIEAKVLTPKEAAEKADYAALAPQVPLSQVGQVAQQQGPVIPPAGVEGDLLGNGPVRVPAENAPIELPTTEVTATPPADSPDGLRKEAQRLERMRTKVAFERAKEVRAEADRLDRLSMESESREQAAERLKLDKEKFAFDKLKEENDKVNKGKTVEQKDKELTTKLSDDYEKNPAVKDYKTVQPLVASMENALPKDSGAADLDMVYALAKIYDPGSVVREGEQVLVVKSGGLPSQVQDWIGWVNGGQRLSSAVRKGMVEQAKSRADNYKQASDAVAASYTRQAKEWGLNPDNIVRSYEVKAREHAGKGPRKEETPKRRASDATKSIDFNDLK